MKLIGKKINRGEYKGFNFAHITLFCTYPLSTTQDAAGEGVTKIKYKGDLSQYDTLCIGNEYRFFYDRYGNAIDFEDASIF